MRKRNVLLGGLIAGAFLLPATAGATVSGQCDGCHTMHASQNGSNGTANPTLLKGAGVSCAGCHTASGFAGAPQVDSSTAILNGGYFMGTPEVDANVHNVSSLYGANSDSNMTGDVPGASGTAYTGYGLDCESCHTAAGHHIPGSYRLISGNTSSDPNAGYGANGATFPGTRADVNYSSTDMNNFCAGCHGDFHEATTGGATGTASPWVRHPTDIRVSTSTEISVDTTYDGTTPVDAVPLGSNGGNNDIIMCISCHVPHGGPYADLLSFDYTANVAGSGGRGTGCETCHGAAGWGF